MDKIEVFMKRYTLQDISDILGLSKSTLSCIKTTNKKLNYPVGKKEGIYLFFTEKEKDRFLEIYNSNHSNPEEKRLIDEGLLFKGGGAAKYVGVSQSKFVRWNNFYHRIPFYRKGQNVYYTKKDLDDFLSTGEKIITKKTKKSKQIKYRPKTDGIIFEKPIYEPHECTNIKCKRITTNKFLCDMCIENNSGAVGDF